MNRRERIVETVHRIAEVEERQAMVGLGRAEAARQEAANEVAALEEREVAAETLLTQGSMSVVERELLWAHRAWTSRERVSTGERLALTEAEVDAARSRLTDRKQNTRVREAVKDKVHQQAHHEREAKAQRELDVIAVRRAGPIKD